MATSKILSWENDLAKHEKRSVAAVFNTALNKLGEESPDALILLHLCAFCDPERIPLSIFILAFSDGPGHQALDWHPWTWFKPALLGRCLEKSEKIKDLLESPPRKRAALRALQRLSLASRGPVGSDDELRFHDLVHQFVRSKMMTQPDGEVWSAVTLLLLSLTMDILENPDFATNMDQWVQITAHFQSAFRFAGRYGVLYGFNLHMAEKVCGYFIMIGDYRKAKDWYEVLSTERRKLLGADHSETLRTEVHIASMTIETDKKAAEKIIRPVAARASVCLGPEHHVTLFAWSTLARCLDLPNSEEDPIASMRNVHSLQESVLGVDYVDTLQSLSVLATLLADRERFREALPLMNKAFVLWDNSLGWKHPITLGCLGKFATQLSQAGQHAKAIAYGREALRRCNDALHGEHRWQVDRRSDLAEILMRAEQYEEAVSLAREALALQERCFNEDDGTGLLLLDILARSLPYLGQYDEAIAIFRETGARREKMFGKHHEGTCLSVMGLVHTLTKCGRQQEAQKVIGEYLGLNDGNTRAQPELLQLLRELSLKSIKKDEERERRGKT